jgi:hypothetical protein
MMEVSARQPLSRAKELGSGTASAVTEKLSIISGPPPPPASLSPTTLQALSEEKETVLPPKSSAAFTVKVYAV